MEAAAEGRDRLASGWPATQVSRPQAAAKVQLGSILEAAHAKIDTLQYLCHALLIQLQMCGKVNHLRVHF